MPEIRSGITNSNFPIGSTWKTAGFEFNFTLDGNLELVSSARGVLWESGTRGRGAGILSMQRDGDLVIYDAKRSRAIWSSGTKGNPGAYLAVQDDGNVVIYADGRKPVWSTGTAIR